MQKIILKQFELLADDIAELLIKLEQRAAEEPEVRAGVIAVTDILAAEFDQVLKERLQVILQELEH